MLKQFALFCVEFESIFRSQQSVPNSLNFFDALKTIELQKSDSLTK